jgi:hypothetical protein
VFVPIAFIAKNPPGWLRQLRFAEGTINSALWLAAVILALPLLIATFRKLQALGLLVAELKEEDLLRPGGGCIRMRPPPTALEQSF